MTFSSETVFLSLGANLGIPKSTLHLAVEEIADLPQTELIQVSPLYRTKPVSNIPQPDFLNIVCELKTLLSPANLLEKLQEIEGKLGKKPKPKNAPRAIDIDLIFYGERKIETDKLTIPHPFWKERLFVLIPLFDLTQESFLKTIIEEFSEEERREVSLLETHWFCLAQNEALSS